MKEWFNSLSDENKRGLIWAAFFVAAPIALVAFITIAIAAYQTAWTGIPFTLGCLAVLGFGASKIDL